MKITENLKIGLDLGSIGWTIIPLLIMAITYVLFVEGGYWLEKSPWTTFNRGLWIICSIAVIYNLLMADVTIIKGVGDGNRR